MANVKSLVAAVLTAVVAVGSVGIAAHAVATSSYRVVGNYGAFEWSWGHARTINTTENLRWATAYVEISNNKTGVRLAYDGDADSIDCNEYVDTKINGYTSGNYNCMCTGTIHGNASANSPVVEDYQKRYLSISAS